jgi:hypothetical protein
MRNSSLAVSEGRLVNISKAVRNVAFELSNLDRCQLLRRCVLNINRHLQCVRLVCSHEEEYIEYRILELIEL